MARKSTPRSKPAGTRKGTGSPLVPELPRDEHEEELIDEALTETFPASDPVSVTVPKQKPRRRKPARNAMHRGGT